MSAPDSLSRWLSELNEPDLRVLLERRPDLLRGPQPRDFDDLAERMWHPYSLTAALRQLDLPSFQVLEMAQFLGDGCTVADAAARLLPTSDRHLADVGLIVDELAAIGVVAKDGDRLLLPDALVELFPCPLGLGIPVRYLLEDLTVSAMNHLQKNLGVARTQRRADTVSSLMDFYRSTETIAAVLNSAPAGTVDELRRLLSERDDDGDDLAPFNLDHYRARKSAVDWASARGLALNPGWGYQVRLPAEVALALLGPDARAPFEPRPPKPIALPVSEREADRGAATAAAQFADHSLSVLDHVTRRPIPRVKSGGVGVRELTRIAKATGIGVDTVRLVLELALSAGLLVADGSKIVTTAAFDSWRRAEPGPRLATLLIEWWLIDGNPSESRNEDGRAVPALEGHFTCASCRLARTGLIAAMVSHDGASDRESWARLTRWRNPTAHVPEDEPDGTPSHVWREAEELGVISQGAVTELGRALTEIDGGVLSELVERATAILPSSAETALFGSDLTAVAVGAPSARVAVLLDRSADRETRGSASTWRFSPSSVRRALDEGITGDALREALTGIAAGDLPSSLEYLISDVARRHGRLRLTTARTCIRSDDEALLAEVAADRKLGKHGLRLLAPTVLAADTDHDELLKALRAAGYFPVSDDCPELPPQPAAQPAGVSAGGRAAGSEPDPTWPRPPATSTARLGPSVNAGQLAARLRRRGSARLAAVSATETELLGHARNLSGSEIRQLAHAIDQQGRVLIDYESGAGKLTRRVVSGGQLIAGSLFAWCELRDDERVFTVSRIRAVMPA